MVIAHVKIITSYSAHTRMYTIREFTTHIWWCIYMYCNGN